MLRTIKKYKAPYLFIYFTIFHIVFCFSTDPNHLDDLYQPYQLEGNWFAGILRFWKLPENDGG